MNWNIQHRKQDKHFACGATCYSMLFNIDEKQARKECETKRTGTATHNVIKALQKRGIPFIRVYLGNRFASVQTQIKLLSREYPLYISGHYTSNCDKGRNSHRHHAILAWKERLFDPSEEMECPVNCYNHVFNKDLTIKEILIVGINKNRDMV